jgi:hypothetical protein
MRRTGCDAHGPLTCVFRALGNLSGQEVNVSGVSDPRSVSDRVVLVPFKPLRTNENEHVRRQLTTHSRPEDLRNHHGAIQVPYEAPGKLTEMARDHPINSSLSTITPES